MRQVASRQRTIAIYGKVYVRRAADPAQPDSQVDLALFAIVQFWKRGNVPVQAEAIQAYCKSELGYSSRTVERALKIGIRDDVLHKPQGGYYQILRREGSQ